MLSNGSILEGTYQIICKMSESESSLMYRARHLKKQCDVIIRQLCNGEMRLDIYGEAVTVLKNMSHEHLPKIYDVLYYNGKFYSVEEEKKGVSLDSYISQHGSMTYAQAYALSMQLVDALQYLHKELMMIHANVLPQNIVVEPHSWILWLTNMDVQYASGLSEYQSDRKTSSGFLAPEQYLIAFEHQAVTLTPATDIYCAGCIMYYMLTGYAPDLRYDQVIPISSLKLDVEPGFQKIIEKMMSYQPDDRFHDALELRKAIDACYKLDKRYRRIKRLGRANVILATAFVLAGSGMIVGGIYKNKMDDMAGYANRLGIADTYVSEKAYYDARDIVMNLEDDYPESLELYQREILYMYMAKDYEDCISRAQTIIKNNFPKEFEEGDYRSVGDFYHVLAQSCYRVGKYDDAQEFIELALEYYDEDYEYYRDYCLILVAQGKIDKAEGELGVSSDLAWDEMERTYVEARIAFASEDYVDATEKYLKVIAGSKDDETMQDAYSSCAEAYDRMGDYCNEVEILKRAISDYPDEYHYRLKIAGTYMAWGDDEEYSALEYYSKALQLYEELEAQFPDDFEIKDRMVMLYQKQSEYETAEQLLLDMTEVFRDQYRVYMWLSYIEDQKQEELKKGKRDYHQMQKYYEKARKLYSSSLGDYYMEDLEERMAELKEEGWFKS